MALRSLSSAELARTPTLFSTFMGHAGSGYKTFAQLLAIYREGRRTLDATADSCNDLRVERFVEDMKASRWEAGLVMRLGVFDGTVLVIDGIHRGIAYLTCVEHGVAPRRLPALSVDC
jgi:hypothetical protein